MENAQQVLSELTQYISKLSNDLHEIEQQQRSFRSRIKYEVLEIKKIYYDYIKAGATGQEAIQLCSEYFGRSYTSIDNVIRWGREDRKKELLQARILAAAKLHSKGFTIVDISNILDISKSAVSRLLKNKTLESNYF